MKETKKCNMCNQEKPLDQFYFNIRISSGSKYHFTKCKTCYNERNALRKLGPMEDNLTPEQEAILDRIIKGKANLASWRKYA